MIPFRTILSALSCGCHSHSRGHISSARLASRLAVFVGRALAGMRAVVSRPLHNSSHTQRRVPFLTLAGDAATAGAMMMMSRYAAPRARHVRPPATSLLAMACHALLPQACHALLPRPAMACCRSLPCPASWHIITLIATMDGRPMAAPVYYWVRDERRPTIAGGRRVCGGSPAACRWPPAPQGRHTLDNLTRACC